MDESLRLRLGFGLVLVGASLALCGAAVDPRTLWPMALFIGGSALHIAGGSLVAYGPQTKKRKSRMSTVRLIRFAYIIAILLWLFRLGG